MGGAGGTTGGSSAAGAGGTSGAGNSGTGGLAGDFGSAGTSGGSIGGVGGPGIAGAGGGSTGGTGGTNRGGAGGANLTGAGGTSVAGAGGTGIGGVGGQAGGGGAGPQLVTIEIVQCLIGPGKSDGTEWDFSASIPQPVTTGLAAALGAQGAGPIINFLGTAAVQALSKPDPMGWVELDWNGAGFDPDLAIILADADTNMENTFQPLWLNARGWRSVPLTSSTMVRVTLIDEDLIDDDDAIGVATISGSQIQGALAAGGTQWIRVEQMTLNQLLAIGIQVTPG
jgi:hypothetical protein